MLEAKLWHNKTETENVKVAYIVKFIKTCDQYSGRFNFSNFFNSLIPPNLVPPVSAWEKTDLQKTLLGRNG